MTAQAINNPFPTFTDSDGSPLEGGYVYFGSEAQDPRTNPVTVYYDEAMTITATQPLRTQAGYLYRNGSPARLYVASGAAISVMVLDSAQRQVSYTQSWQGVEDAAGVAAAAAAQPYVDLAQDWATKTDGEVVTGQGYGAKKYAEDAAASATDALGTLSDVQAAGDLVLSAADIYANDTAGLAATASGGYYGKISTDADESVVIMLDNAGTAVEQKRLPAAGLVTKLAARAKATIAILMPGYAIPSGWQDTGERAFGMRVIVFGSDSLLTGIFESSEKGFALFPSTSALYQEDTMATVADDDAEAVGGAKDISPNEHSFTQSDSTKRPQLKISGSAKYIKFDGSNDLLNFPASAINRSAFTLVASVALRSNGTFPQIIGDTAASGLFCGFDSSRKPRLSISGGTAVFSTLVGATAIPLSTRTTITYKWDGTNGSIYINGTQDATQVAANPGTIGNGTQPIMCYSGVGGLTAFIDLYGAVLVGAALSDADRNLLEAVVASDNRVVVPASIAKRITDTEDAIIASALSDTESTYGVVALSSTHSYHLGDSTSANYLGATAVMDLISSARTKHSLADPGDTITDQKTVWNATSITKAKTGWVSIMVGVNDIDGVTTPATIIARLQDLVDTVRNAVGRNTYIVICKMTPCKQRFINSFGASLGATAYSHWQTINDAIAGSGSTPITNVDARVTSHEATMNDGSGNLAAIYDTGDGIHANTAGHTVVANAIRDALLALGLTV